MTIGSISNITTDWKTNDRSSLGSEQDKHSFSSCIRFRTRQWRGALGKRYLSLSRRIVPWRYAATMHSANEDQPQTGILSAASGTQGSQQRRSRDWQVHSCSFSLTGGRLIGFWKWWRISKSKCGALAVFNGRVNSSGYVPGQRPLHFHLCHKRDQRDQSDASPDPG